MNGRGRRRGLTVGEAPPMMRAVDLSLAVPLAIFVLTYSVIAIGKFPGLRLDRAGAAFAGAVAMVVSGALSEDAARAAIDFRTLALLLGMMIVVANLRLSGAFTFFARALLNARNPAMACWR